MTGFARQSGRFENQDTAFDWFWEIKSVNGKSLDIKNRLPNWLDDMSFSLKNIAQKYFERGSLSVYLEVAFEKSEQKIIINHELLEQLSEAAIELYQKHKGCLALPSASDLLNVNAVVEVEKKRFDEELLKKLQNELIVGFEQCCLKLQIDRQQEGQKIKSVLEQMVEKIKTLANQIATLAEKTPAELKAKLWQQISDLIEGNQNVSEERLAQEVVLLVNRADIREEIDRLKAHIKTAEEFLQGNQTLGRRFDFLCQELNREANTTCSKAADVNIINLGMELKATIEQLREQVQNME